MGRGGAGEGSAKGSLLYTDDVGWELRADAVLCVRR